MIDDQNKPWSDCFRFVGNKCARQWSIVKMKKQKLSQSKGSCVAGLGERRGDLGGGLDPFLCPSFWMVALEPPVGPLVPVLRRGAKEGAVREQHPVDDAWEVKKDEVVVAAG
jgi:hypothetical protein